MNSKGLVLNSSTVEDTLGPFVHGQIPTYTVGKLQPHSDVRVVSFPKKIKAELTRITCGSTTHSPNSSFATAMNCVWVNQYHIGSGSVEPKLQSAEEWLLDTNRPTKVPTEAAPKPIRTSGTLVPATTKVIPPTIAKTMDDPKKPTPRR